MVYDGSSQQLAVLNVAAVGTDALVQLVFSGECIAGRDPQAVRSAVSAALKLDEERTARLFCGQPVVLKRQVDVATAMRHIARFSTLGAVLRVQPMAVGGASATVPSAHTAVAASRPSGPKQLPLALGLSLGGLCLALLGAFWVGEKLGQGSQAGRQALPARVPVVVPVTAAAPAPEQAAPLADRVAGAGVDDELTAQLSPQAAQDYQRSYLSAKWHRAFAVSDSGAHAWVSDAASEDEAREAALQRCVQLARSGACRVVDVNGQRLE